MKWVCLWSYEERTGPKENKDLAVFIIQPTSKSEKSLVLCDPVDTDLPSYWESGSGNQTSTPEHLFSRLLKSQPRPDLGNIRIQRSCVAKSIGRGNNIWILALAFTDSMTLHKSFLFFEPWFSHGTYNKNGSPNNTFNIYLRGENVKCLNRYKSKALSLGLPPTFVPAPSLPFSISSLPPIANSSLGWEINLVNS